MTITVNTPDGGTASFPDDTDPGTITSVMKAKFGGPDGKPASSGYGDNDSLASKAGNTAYRAADTGTLGALDWGLAGVHKLERATGYDPNATDIDQIHKQNDEWQSAHPLLALGGDAIGYSAGLGKLRDRGQVGQGRGGARRRLWSGAHCRRRGRGGRRHGGWRHWPRRSAGIGRSHLGRLGRRARAFGQQRQQDDAGR